MQCCGSLSAPCRYRHPGSSPHSTTVDRQHATMPASHVVWWWRVPVSVPPFHIAIFFFFFSLMRPPGRFPRLFGRDVNLRSAAGQPVHHGRSSLPPPTVWHSLDLSLLSLPLCRRRLSSSRGQLRSGEAGDKSVRGSQTALGLADVYRRRRRMPRMWNSMTSRTASFLFVFLRSHIGVGSYANACTVHPYIVHTYMMQDRASSSRTTWPITRDERGRFTEPTLGLSD